MSILAHGVERSFHATRAQDAHAVALSKKQQETLKRISLRALAVLSMGGVLTALIALKTAIFMWRLHY
jgi:hypothetical protein